MWRASVLFALAACAADDPQPTNGNGGIDETIEGVACAPAPAYVEDVSGCAPSSTDYLPRTGGDTWPACISDDNTYHPIEASISTIARVEAFEQVADLLWRGEAPTHQEFIDARLIFDADQGLGSRVERRYDPHYPSGGDCGEAGIPEASPDYCVGPATLQPIIVDAFAGGAEGRDRVVNAARIEAALLWFFYVSVIKEATTCTATPRDCDSAWAYYAGGATREQPIGLAAYVDALGPETHDRSYDGVLAVRCWKNLDNESGVSTDLARRDLAIGQTDTALLRGVALLVRQRFAALACSTGDYQLAAHEQLRILLPLLDRATRARDPGTADWLLAEIAKAAGDVDVASSLEWIDAAYGCP